jgi:hypothetical protein
VQCIRLDGARKEWARYATEKLAATEAARLCIVGCAAEVVHNDTMPVEKEARSQ